MRIPDWVHTVFAIVAGFLLTLPSAYAALLAAMVADIVMGLLRAAVQGRVSSRASFRGMVRKAAILVLVAMSALLGRWLGVETAGIEAPIGQAVAVFFTVTEAISVLENAAAIGVPVPRFLRNALEMRSPDKFGGGHANAG
ncbi:phage holin family protein [Chloroflexus sp.]|uniref:phage holin family protein n=1 Tax=Chloroflexus sp. TaxID=1904827 RepID=UPI002ACD8713|nr:phage holin family protein [Chloroflexus sp.]